MSRTRVQAAQDDVDLSRLDLGHLALFVGERFNRAVLAALAEAGLGDLRGPHGYVIQHLIRGPRRLGALAPEIGVSQQAVSKLVAELVEGGYVSRELDPDDRRVVVLELTARGVGAVELARMARADLEGRLRQTLGDADVDQARRLLASALEALGEADAVRGRRVRAPG